MSAVDYINSLSAYLIAVIVAGGILMGGVQALKMSMADDEMEIARAKKNIKTTIKAVILGSSVTGLIYAIFKTIGR